MAGKGAFQPRLDAVGIEDVLRLPGDVEKLRNGILHAESQLIGFDDPVDSVRCAGHRCGLVIEILNQVNLLALQILFCRCLDIGHEALIGNCSSLIVGRQKRAAVI